MMSFPRQRNSPSPALADVEANAASDGANGGSSEGSRGAGHEIHNRTGTVTGNDTPISRQSHTMITSNSLVICHQPILTIPDQVVTPMELGLGACGQTHVMKQL